MQCACQLRPQVQYLAVLFCLGYHNYEKFIEHANTTDIKFSMSTLVYCCNIFLYSSFEYSVLLFRFQVKKKQFFRNFMTIVMFGAIGTLISFIIISLGMHIFLEFITQLSATSVFISISSLRFSNFTNVGS